MPKVQSHNELKDPPPEAISQEEPSSQQQPSQQASQELLSDPDLRRLASSFVLDDWKNVVDWMPRELARGTIHYVAVPYKFQFPPLIVEKDELTGDRFRIYTDSAAFDLMKILDSEGKSQTVEVAQQVKVRPFVILQSNSLKRLLMDLDRRYIIGVPIKTVKPKHRNNRNFYRLLKSQKIPYLYYLRLDKEIRPGIIEESVIDLTSIITIDESYFSDYLGFLRPRELKVVMRKIQFIFDIGRC